MCFTAKPAVVCELSTRYEAAISISEASCMGCSSLYRWDAVAECRFVQQVQNTLPDQEQWISTCSGEFMPSPRRVAPDRASHYARRRLSWPACRASWGSASIAHE